MKRYNRIKESFSSVLYKEILKELLKHLPKEAFKDISAYGSKLGYNKNWEVTIPKNSIFKKGLYVHVGRAEDSFDAKAKALNSILKRFDNPEDYGTFDELVKEGSIR